MSDYNDHEPEGYGVWLGDHPTDNALDEPKKVGEFEYQLLLCTLFMSQVPCDASYDREMAKLLGLVKKAHDKEIALLKTAPKGQV